MNDNARKTYRPAPTAGEMKCPKCNSLMVPSKKNPKVSTCVKCNFSGTRVKLS